MKTTRRFTIDKRGRKAYVGSRVLFRNRTWLIEDIDYLSWNTNQYLTLTDPRNKTSKLQFISPKEVSTI
jgi:hypothetical protein